MARKILAALAAIVAAATIASAAPDAFFQLPRDPLAEELRALEPSGLPPKSALDALADASRVYSRETERDRAADLDEPTVLNGIALSRQSGIPIALNELRSFTDTSSRVSTDARDLVLERDDVLSALLLGIPPTTGALTDVLTSARRWSSTDVSEQEVVIGNDEALAGLALLARGIELDPHVLIEIDAQARGSSRTRQLADLSADPTVSQTVSLPGDTAKAAAAVFEADRPVDPDELANSTRRTSDRGAYARAVEIPEEVLLGALAFAANGLGVESADVLSVHEARLVQREHEVARELDRETVLNALLLGAHVSRAAAEPTPRARARLRPPRSSPTTARRSTTARRA